MFSTPLLNGITELEHENILAQWCRIKQIKSGQPIVNRDAHNTDLFILMEGTAEAKITEDFRMEIETGMIFGELSFIDGEPRSALVKATSDCSVASLSLEDFSSLSRKEPALALTIMTNLAKTATGHVRNTNEKVRSLNHSLRTSSQDLQQALDQEVPGWMKKLAGAFSG